MIVRWTSAALQDRIDIFEDIADRPESADAGEGRWRSGLEEAGNSPNL